MSLRAKNIPQDLKECHQWVAWKAVPKKNGKTDKIPICARTGFNASHSNPKTWGAFKQAVARYHSDKLAGVGFVFSENDPYCGVDLDNCRNPEDGKIEPWALEIIKNFGSYTEVSQSGGGVHIITKGKLPCGGRKNERIEIYDKLRFFCMTGQPVEGTPSEIRPSQEAIDQLLDAHFKKESTPKDITPPARPVIQGDVELIQRARESKNGPKFHLLFSGKWEAAGYPSQSEADQALCNMLAFWTGNDPERIDRLFRQSALIREKWDKKHHGDGAAYGEKTIERAKASEIYGCTKKARSTMKNGTNEKKPQRREIRKLTDLGNAERFVDDWKDDVRYNCTSGKWLIYNDSTGVWVADLKNEINRRAKITIRNIAKEASQVSDEKLFKAILEHARRSESEPKRRAMLTLAQSEAGIPVLANELDLDRMLLNCLNGAVDLRAGKLLPHKREYLMTKLAPVEFTPSAMSPTWGAFLERIMAGNKNLISFLQRAVGYSLTGDTRDQCLFFLHGKGANGKTTFIETIRALLGDYSSQADFNSFLEKKYDSVRNDLARLKGSRIVSATEAGQGKRLAEVLVKQITGGDTIAARFLFREYFEFKPEFKIWLAANHKPEIRGTDHAIWRRIRLIPFNVTIPEHEQDKDLPAKLKAELPGVLNWAIEGCLQWQRNGLGVPEEVRSATEDYRAEMDILAGFLTDRCLINDRLKVKAKDLYQQYIQWCDENGEKPVTQKTFGARLSERGLPRKRGTGNVHYWHGIGLLDEASLRDTSVSGSEVSMGNSEPKGRSKGHSNMCNDSSELVHNSDASDPSDPFSGYSPHEEENIAKYPENASLSVTNAIPKHLVGRIDPKLAEEIYCDS